MARHRKPIIDVASAIVLLSLVALDGAVWKDIFSHIDRGHDGGARIYFLPVPQGESALLILPNDMTVLTDAGPDAGIVDDLQKSLPPSAGSYIDLAIISYPQAADYEGYQYLLQHYRVGAFLYNGRADISHSAAWKQLMGAISAKHIPLITLGAGDRLRFGATAAPDGEIDVLSPDASFAQSADPADTGIVQRVITQNLSVLLAADIGTGVEGILLARSGGMGAGLRATILKAPFPGLGATAGDVFLKAVAPRAIVVGPGVRDAASAPTKAMLAHIASSTNAEIDLIKPGVFLLYNK